MKQIVLTVIITSLVICSCKDDNIPISITDDQLIDNTYLFAVANSAEECGVLLSNVVECAQSIDFSSPNNVLLILADIVNAGIYNVDRDTITVTLIDSDSKNPMIFTTNPETAQLIRISDGSNDVWKLAMQGIDSWDF
jgi:hypothetical protein